MRRLPFDPLATRRSRLVSFFLLYVSEGLPQGFTITAVATQMRRLGVSPADIGTFVAALYLPWAVKWAAGPVVDTLAPRRFGPRRFWIVLSQALMVVTLLVAMPLDFARDLRLFTLLLFVHNVFAATQDVAIDALAVNALPPDERGVANGFMFAGSMIGQGLGGGGVLWLASIVPFGATWLLVAGAVAAIGLAVSWRLREAIPPVPGRPAPGRAAAEAARRIGAFAHDAWQAFTRSRAARFGVLLALLPMGATGLGLALLSNLAVEVGLDDRQVGTLSLLSALIGATFCILGGWISDRFGRRRSVATFVALMSLPTLALALALSAGGITLPAADPGARLPPAVGTIAAFWACALLFAVFNGLMYGAGTALYMDITTPRVAATQFTAYMALCNLSYALSAKWQGHAAGRFGYPLTLGLDAAVGLVCLLVLPFVAAPRDGAARPAGLAPPSGAAPGTAIPEGVVP